MRTQPNAFLALEDLVGLIGEAVQAAYTCIAPERAQAMMAKWLPTTAPDDLGDARLLSMMADAALLSGDLLLSQPVATGTTAFDRVARRRDGGAPKAPVLDILQSARFRLVRLDGAARHGERPARDAVSGQKLGIVGIGHLPLPDGLTLFARTAMLDHDTCYLAGAVTPLDEAALKVAARHLAAGAPGPAANARWAEAVYAHVVRNGTLDIPGLNRPGEDADADGALDGATGEEDALFVLADAWKSLGGAAPDARLLRETRRKADQATMMDALTAAAIARAAGQPEAADALERLLVVMMETALHRERSAVASSLTLDQMTATLDAAIARKEAPRPLRALWDSLRARASGGTAGAGARAGGRADDPELAKLIQRIQGLRAKTVAQGCTEAEALAAAEKVAELLDRYGLSLGELEFKAQPCDGIGIETTRKRMGPIDQCIPAIAAFFDCRVWAEHSKGRNLRYVFFGLRADVLAAQYLYEMVERAFETETAAFRAGDVYARMEGERRTASNSFQLGLARGIAGKLSALRASREAGRQGASGRDLVPMKAAIIDEEMELLGLALTARQSGGRKRVLHDAYAAGEAAGQRFEVMAGITKAA